jgi:hypothetical protein
MPPGETSAAVKVTGTMRPVTPAKAGVHPYASTRRSRVPRRSRLDTGLRRYDAEFGPEAWAPARAA